MKKILVIDYDQSSLQNLQKVLTQEGFEVVLAGDGQAGWEKFQSEKPDLVLMEAMLSKIHGFELCDRITKDPVSRTPVFIMTGVYKDRVYRTEDLRTYGASEYFEKPLDMPKFMASIHGLLTVPDIKPGPEAEPTNGREPVPAVKPAPEAPRRAEPPAEPKLPKPEPPRPRVAAEGNGGGVGGLNLETILNVHPQPKAKPAADAKARKDEELRLEALLNDIAAAAEERHRPEPPKSVRPVPTPLKETEAKPQEHARKDHEAEDIDKLLKTTLADFGLEGEKKRPIHPAPAPAPAPRPAPERPRQASPVPPPAPRVQAKPVPPPAPPAPAAVAAPPPAAPEKAKVVAPPSPPPAVQEKAKPAVPPSPPPAVAEKPKQAQPTPKPVAPPAKPRPEPKPEPAAAKAEPRPRAHEAEAKKSPEGRIFKDIYEVEKKKSPVPFIAVGAGVLAVAAVAFFLLRPKHNPNPAGAGATAPTTQMQSSAPEKAPDTTLPSLSEEKLKAVNAKPKPTPQANRPVESLPGAAEAIAPPTIADVSRLNAKASPEKKPEAKPAETKPAETKPAETKAADVLPTNPQTAAQGGAQPPTGTETAAPQGTAAGAADAGASGVPADKASPGDLVPLASVDEPPTIVKSVQPVYPAQAARFGKAGSVTVNALINESGAVAETGILKGLKDDMGMEKAAMDAVRKWKFQPAKKDGVNVKVWKPIVITFRADKARTP